MFCKTKSKHSYIPPICLVLTSFIAGSYDVDYPVECDDEYWEDADGNPVFEQPPDKPAKPSFFRYFLRLKQIHMYALRTIVSISIVADLPVTDYVF